MITKISPKTIFSATFVCIFHLQFDDCNVTKGPLLVVVYFPGLPYVLLSLIALPTLSDTSMYDLKSSINTVEILRAAVCGFQHISTPLLCIMHLTVMTLSHQSELERFSFGCDVVHVPLEGLTNTCIMKGLWAVLCCIQGLHSNSKRMRTINISLYSHFFCIFYRNGLSHENSLKWCSMLWYCVFSIEDKPVSGHMFGIISPRHW